MSSTVPFERVVVVGDDPTGRPEVEAFQRRMVKHDCVVEHYASADECLGQMGSSGNASAYLALHVSLNERAPGGRESRQNEVAKLWHRGVNTMVYCADCSAQSAIDCARAGAIDVVMEGDGLLVKHADLFREGTPLYPKIYWKDSRSEPADRMVFLISPWKEDVLGPFRAGVITAFRALGLEILEGNEEHLDDSVYAKVTQGLEKAGGAVANLANVHGTDRQARYNANVYFEAGFAKALGKKVILARPKSDGRLPLPTDIAGLQYIEFRGEVDLGVQLYYGLKHGNGW